MLDLLWFLLLGHIFGDFAFQSDETVLLKRTSNRTLTLHVLLYTLTIALFLFVGLAYVKNEQFFTLLTAMILAAIFVEHWVQDLLKERRFSGSKQSFYFDQALHVLVLFAVRIFFYNT